MTTISGYRHPFPARTRLAQRDPFGEFDTIVRHAFGAPATPGFRPAAEILRDGDDAVVRLEIPGVDVEKDVTVEVQNRRLIVRGERRDETAEGDATRTLRELRYGAFERSFALPAGVAAEKVSATYDKGVLSVRVAGVHAGSEPTRIAVSTAPAVVEGGSGTEGEQA